jgi:hypothetical protein
MSLEAVSNPQIAPKVKAEADPPSPKGCGETRSIHVGI